MSARTTPNALAPSKGADVFDCLFVCDASVFALFEPLFVRIVQGLAGPTVQFLAQWLSAFFCGFIR